MADSEEFSAFVSATSPALLRSAWLLTGSHASAQDLVQAALFKSWTRWSQVRNRDQPAGYVRQVMLSLFLTGQRRRWRGEIPFAVVPDELAAEDESAAADLRTSVRAALGELSGQQRAVVVLRYFDDLSEAQTAELIGTSVGTVKSHTSWALAQLRATPQLRDLWDEEVTG